LMPSRAIIWTTARRRRAGPHCAEAGFGRGSGRRSRPRVAGQVPERRPVRRLAGGDWRW
jgi:hypothetical protein